MDNSIRLKKFLNIVNILATKYKKRIIISTHPRTQKKLDKFMKYLSKHPEWLVIDLGANIGNKK